MSRIPHELLQPSLSAHGQVKAAPYSQQTSLLSAFFGGPMAITLLFAIDARRLGRLPRDAVWIVLMLAAYGGWLLVAYASPAATTVQAFLVELVGQRGPEIAERLIALLLFALAFGLHRAEQRSADLFGLERPAGLGIGIALVIGGLLASLALRSVLH